MIPRARARPRGGGGDAFETLAPRRAHRDARDDAREGAKG